MDALQFEKVSFSYGGGQFSLSDVSFHIPARCFATILGANGAGKSTLFRLACGILQPSSGTIFSSGDDVLSMDRTARARVIAYVAQHPPPGIAMTVEEYVLLGRVPYARTFAFTTDDDFRSANEAMKMTDCAVFRHSRLNALSGGELQRVLVARAIAQQPRVLLLDEPNSHLDVHHQLMLFRALQNWQTATGGTVIASTHDLNLASMFGDQCLVLNDGRLVASGTPASVLTSELLNHVFRVQTEVIAGYYGAAPAVQLLPQ